MKELIYPLYILGLIIGSARPRHASNLKQWYQKFSSSKETNFEPLKFCRALELNSGQTKKYLEAFHNIGANEFFQELSSNQIYVVSIFCKNYPPLLTQIPDPPVLLFCRGNIKLLNATYPMAMVGSRRSTSYGNLVVQKIISNLSGRPITVTSGLAYGIDAEVHKQALNNNLSTIAVLGGGLSDKAIYPRENLRLAQDILDKNGLLISEYQPKATAMKHQFIARNRIIAGLTKLTLVVEAASKSGALLTADFALEYNRCVMTIPGSILSPQSHGTNELIKQGAVLLNSYEQIVEELQLPMIEENNSLSQNLQLSPEERAVLEYIQQEPCDFDQLIQHTQLPTHNLQTIISSLHLKSVIKEVGPQLYQKL